MRAQRKQYLGALTGLAQDHGHRSAFYMAPEAQAPRGIAGEGAGDGGEFVHGRSLTGYMPHQEKSRPKAAFSVLA